MERVFQKEDFSLRYELVRARRKTLAIHITAGGEAVVKAPNRCPQALIDDFIFRRREWIMEKTALQKLRGEQKERFSIREGDFLLLLGREYSVKWGDVTAFNGTEFTIPKWETDEEFFTVKAKLTALYKSIAEPIFLERAGLYAEKIGVLPASVKLSNARTLWGSCSGKNSVHLSWRLIMGSQTAVDYVVVHELCHIKQHNHSPKFWSEVEKAFPEYKNAEKELKILQKKLSSEDW